MHITYKGITAMPDNTPLNILAHYSFTHDNIPIYNGPIHLFYMYYIYAVVRWG